METKKQYLINLILISFITVNLVFSVVQITFSFFHHDINSCFSIMDPVTWLIMKGFVGIICSGALLAYKHRYANNDGRENKTCVICVGLADFSLNIVLTVIGSVMLFHFCSDIEVTNIKKLMFASLVFDYVLLFFVAVGVIFNEYLFQKEYVKVYEVL